MGRTEVLRWNRAGHAYVLFSDGQVCRRLHSSAEGFERVYRVSTPQIPLIVEGVLRNPDCVVVG